MIVEKIWNLTIELRVSLAQYRGRGGIMLFVGGAGACWRARCFMPLSIATVHDDSVPFSSCV